jgi:AAA+ ATPase superfamily predicted ATPase
MFVDRTDELAMLQQILSRQRSELLLLYGRRRVGNSNIV